MTPGETCATCKAFSALSNECRRKAPTAMLVNGPKGPAGIGIYPATSKDGWCCEWEPAEQKKSNEWVTT